MKRAFAGIVACCCGFIAMAAMAGGPAGVVTPTPEDIVRQLYADDIVGTQRQNPFEKIGAYASRSFAKAAEKEEQCEKSVNYCAFDFDVLNHGQCGGKVTDLRLKRRARSNGVIVCADFNLDCGYENTSPFPRVVLFRFVQEDGAWKIDDVGLGYKQQIQSHDYGWYNRQRRKH